MSGPGGQQIVVGGNEYFAQDFYIYTAAFGNLAALGTNTQNVQIQSDSDFEWIEATYFGVLHGQTAPFTTIPLPVNITLVDSGSSRQLFNAPLPLSSFAGDGRQPFILPVSRLFKAYSNIQATATSFDAANVYDFVSLNFIGRKLFRNAN
jgi:hypothetical protein